MQVRTPSLGAFLTQHLRALRALGTGILVAGLVLLASPPASRSAEATFGLTGGTAIPFGDTGDVLATGFDGGAFADVWLNDQFAIGVEIGGGFHGFTDDAEQALEDLLAYEVAVAHLFAGDSIISIDANAEGSASVIRVVLRGRWQAPTRGGVRPFLHAGGGLYNVRPSLEGSVHTTYSRSGTIYDEDIAFDESDSENKFGVNLGGGLIFRMGSAMELGVGAALHHVFNGLAEDEPLQSYSVAAALTFVSAPR